MKKVIINILLVIFMIFQIGYIMYMKIPQFLGYGSDYTSFDKKYKYNNYKISKDIILYNPITHEKVGILKKNIQIIDPSFTDAVDLGDSLTYKIPLDIDEKDIELLPLESNGLYIDILANIKQ